MKPPISYKTGPADGYDEESLQMAVKMMAEELGVCDLLAMVFVLDEEYKITAYNERVSEQLLFNRLELIDKPLSDFFIEESKSEWDTLAPVLEEGNFYDTPKMFLKTKHGLFASVYCFVSVITFKIRETLVIAIEAPQQNGQDQQILNESIERLQQQLKEIQESGDTPKYSAHEKKVIKITEDAVRTPVNPRHMPSMEELAQRAGMSLTTFREVFKQIYGMSMLPYFKKQVMAKAKVLLLDRQRTIMEVSIMLRYELAAFCRAFKDETGQTPTEFRNQPSGTATNPEKM